MSSLTTAATQSIALPLNLYPGLNSFALDLVTGSGTAGGFVRRTALESVTPSRKRAPDALVAALETSNRAWGNDVSAELERWREGETVTLVAGQQVCFAGGPLLIPVKLASLLRLRDLLAQKGVAATVFFWLATEDHDYEEAASITLAGKDFRRKLRAAAPDGNRRIVGPRPVDAALRREFLELMGIETPRWLREGISYGDSFAELMAEVFSGRGVVLVDSMLPELRREGRELFRAMVERMDECERLVSQRSDAIREAGYKPQVIAGEDGHYSFLYRVAEGGLREPIRSDDGQLAIGGRQVEREEVLALVENSPESISTGVLARPLLQDLVLGPDVFIGGPSEVSYYAQLAPLHELFRVEPPHVGLRAHLLAAPQRTLRTVDRYSISPEELFLPTDEIVTRRDPSLVTKMRGAIQDSGSKLEEDLAEIKSTILDADPTLGRSVERTLGRIRYHLRKLEERGERAALRSDGERYSAISRLSETLFPDGAPQDRHTAWIPFWFQYGTRFIDRIIEEVEPDAAVLKVIGL